MKGCDMVPAIAVAAVAAVIGGTCWWIWKARHSLAARRSLTGHLIGDQAAPARALAASEEAPLDYGPVNGGDADDASD